MASYGRTLLQRFAHMIDCRRHVQPTERGTSPWRPHANTHWEGPLIGGSGTTSLDSSARDLRRRLAGAHRAAGGKTSPEELIAAAHSACYSMAFSHGLAQAGTPPQSVDTRADVTFQPGEGITGVVSPSGRRSRSLGGGIPGGREDAKDNCPVSKALTGTTITLDASLEEQQP